MVGGVKARFEILSIVPCADGFSPYTITVKDTSIGNRCFICIWADDIRGTMGLVVGDKGETVTITINSITTINTALGHVQLYAFTGSTPFSGAEDIAVGDDILLPPNWTTPLTATATPVGYGSTDITINKDGDSDWSGSVVLDATNSVGVVINHNVFNPYGYPLALQFAHAMHVAFEDITAVGIYTKSTPCDGPTGTWVLDHIDYFGGSIPANGFPNYPNDVPTTVVVS